MRITIIPAQSVILHRYSVSVLYILNSSWAVLTVSLSLGDLRADEYDTFRTFIGVDVQAALPSAC